MYSTEQLLKMLNERLEEYQQEIEKIENAANQSVNPDEYRETPEYKKNIEEATLKKDYISNVIKNVSIKNNNMESIGSSLLDRRLIKNVGIEHRVSPNRLEELQRKNGEIEERQRKSMTTKYNKIIRRIERQAEILGEKRKTIVEESNLKDKIKSIPNKKREFKNNLNSWRSNGILGIMKGKKLPNFIKGTAKFGYTVVSCAQNLILKSRLLSLKLKSGVLNDLSERVCRTESNIEYSGKVR